MDLHPLMKMAQLAAEKAKPVIEHPLEDVMKWAKRHLGEDVTTDKLDNIAKYWERGSRVPAWRVSKAPEVQAWETNMYGNPGSHFDLTPEGRQAMQIAVNDHDRQAYLAPYLLRSERPLVGTDNEINGMDWMIEMLGGGRHTGSPYHDGGNMILSVEDNPVLNKYRALLKEGGFDSAVYPNTGEGLGNASGVVLSHPWEGRDSFLNLAPGRPVAGEYSGYTPFDKRDLVAEKNLSMVVFPGHGGSRDLFRADFNPERYFEPEYFKAKGGLIGEHTNG